jgi:tRNA pseudouridine38/39 synthase
MPQENLRGSQKEPDYSTWSTSSLIDRITELERQLQSQTAEFSASRPSTVNDVAPAPIQENAVSAGSPDVRSKTKSKNSPPPDDFTRVRAPTRPAKGERREIDPSKYHTRFIALKFAYLGQRYNGYEHANGNVTPLPTIEEELWKALRRACLIFPSTTSLLTEDGEHNGPRGTKPFTLSWEGCDYSKCGRTDRGVSAFGQVIGIRVRSARPKSPCASSSRRERLTQRSTSPPPDVTIIDPQENAVIEDDSATVPSPEENDPHDVDPGDDWDDIADEIPYIQILNNVLPKDIRILAWCPHPPPGFDARFSCRERRYKYFFTQPAFSPTPGSSGFTGSAAKALGLPGTKLREGWLDIDAMREGAKHFVGVHDFRNFCRVDTSKQITNFERIIYHADIELVDPKTHPLGFVGEAGFRALDDDLGSEKPAGEGNLPSTPLVYTFSLHGSAFLWHQVRHMVAILFLIGQGLESPSIVPELLDVSKNPRKPTYEMASDAPLVLWDCVFPDEESGNRDDALEWVYAGDPRLKKSSLGKGDEKYGRGGIVEGLWTVWRQRKMDEILAGALLDLTVSQGDRSIGSTQDPTPKKLSRSQKIFHGGNEVRLGGKYVPVMQRRKMDTVEVQNARYLAGKERRAEKNGEDERAEM